MPSNFKNLLANLGLSLTALLATALVLEFVVFGLVLKPDDLLENVTVDSVVRYKPGTQAIFRHPGGHTTKVTINQDGWNSTKPSYRLDKAPGMARIAVLGDSYVHGAFVDVQEGFPHLVETGLREKGFNVELYRFGMDGAPLSQYLNMLRREVIPFRPDIVVVPLIHNDFDESYRFLKTRYASSFMKLERDPGGTITEIAPTDFRPGLADRLRASATFRYLYYETGLYLKLKGTVNALFWGGSETYQPQFIQSAVDIRKITDHASNRFFTRYVMAEMKKLSLRHGFKLVFVMDGVRDAIYDGNDLDGYEVAKLNAMAATVARDLDIEFLDLHTAFADDYAEHKTRFEFPYDWHWNVRANAIVAGQIIDRITRDKTWLKPATLPAKSSTSAAGANPGETDG